jgi:hypothetical protein
LEAGVQSQITKAVVVCLLLATCGVLTHAEGTNSAAKAANLVRAINTLEANHELATGRYASLNEFIAADEVNGLAIPQGNLLRQYEIRLTVSPDRKNYTVLVQEKSDPSVTFYSDERAVIYQAAPIQ